MVQQVIDVGSSASDGTGDPLRNAFTKINDNFTELYSTVDNEGLTYGNVASNVTGITFNVTRYAENYAATPVLGGTGQVVGNVYVIRGNVLGGSTPLNDVLLTVTTLANATVGNVAAVTATGVPIAPVLRVNGLTGNVTLTVNNITGAASKAYVNAAIASNIANVTGSVTDSLSANITAANAVISNHAARITTLESNAATQASAINNLTNTKATIAYVDTSIDLALSSNAILANVAAVNANVAAANAAILLRANLTGANFSGNISANSISASNYIRTDTYFVGGTEVNQGLGESWANPAALFFGNSAVNAGPAGNRFYQVNLQNLDPQGSGDFVVTADDGNDGSNYVSFGVNGSQWNDPIYPAGKAHDGFVYVTGGNLIVQSETNDIQFYLGNISVPQVTITAGNVIQFAHNTVIRFSDGTVQSTAFGGNTNVTAINANITAANAAITALQANAASQALDLDNLFANAATQASSINTLTTNAASQAATLNSINANVGAYQTFANSNAASQTTSINLLNANVTAANLNITTLQSNAASQALDINNLYANINSYLSNVATSNANIAAANARIIVIDANLGSTSTNVSTLQSNSIVQAIQIDLLNANVAAANVNISTKANVNGDIFNGNIQANYIIANSNVKITSTLEVGNLSPINYPGLGGVFVGNVDSYYQVVIQNLNTGANASGDFVITADDGTDEVNYINIGLNSSNFSGNFTVPDGDTGLPDFAHDGYITVIGGNVAIRSNINAFLVANTAAVSLLQDNDFALLTCNLRFRDGTIQQTAIQDVPDLYANIGTLSLFQSNIVGNAAYTPNNAANYNGTVTNVQQALDQLAARLRALGG